MPSPHYMLVISCWVAESCTCDVGVEAVTADHDCGGIETAWVFAWASPDGVRDSGCQPAWIHYFCDGPVRREWRAMIVSVESGWWRRG